MAAIVLSLVYRQVQHLTDVLRSLEIEGLMWVEATKVSKQALSQRLNSLPAHLFALVFEQVIERLSAKRSARELAPAWVISSTEISCHLDWGCLNTRSDEKTFWTTARKNRHGISRKDAD
ncbi:hypothetical protein NSTCB13_01806 [Nostoc sp. DSM 114160]|jgi:hypothetical protein